MKKNTSRNRPFMGKEAAEETREGIFRQQEGILPSLEHQGNQKATSIYLPDFASHSIMVNSVKETVTSNISAQNVKQAYTEQLTAVARGDQMLRPNSHISGGTELPTPININRLLHYLQGYDVSKSTFLINGFVQGFKIPFQGTLPCNLPRNLISASQFTHIIDAKISAELAANRISGPFTHIPFTDLVISPIGVVEKKIPGTFRMIHHLSFPRGGSINSGISTGISQSRSTLGVKLLVNPTSLQGCEISEKLWVDTLCNIV